MLTLYYFGKQHNSKKQVTKGHLLGEKIHICVSVAQERERFIRSLPDWSQTWKTGDLAVTIAQNAFNEVGVRSINFQTSRFKDVFAGHNARANLTLQ